LRDICYFVTKLSLERKKLGKKKIIHSAISFVCETWAAIWVNCLNVRIRSAWLWQCGAQDIFFSVVLDVSH